MNKHVEGGVGLIDFTRQFYCSICIRCINIHSIIALCSLLGNGMVEFVIGRYAVVFYASVTCILTAVASLQYIAMLPVSAVFGLVAAIG